MTFAFLVKYFVIFVLHDFFNTETSKAEQESKFTEMLKLTRNIKASFPAGNASLNILCCRAASFKSHFQTEGYLFFSFSS